MLLPNRYNPEPDYRYGFQGQEVDNELKGGKGNSLNYKYRMHDPRVGRFFAVDPLTKKYPHYSPYSFSGNKVVHRIELEGLEDAPAVSGSEVDGQESIDGNWVFFKDNDYEGKEGQNDRSLWIPKPSTEEIENTYNDIRKLITKTRNKGSIVAADNLESYLNGEFENNAKVEDLDFLMKVDGFQDALEFNQFRFINEPNSRNESLFLIALKLKDGETTTFSDYWDASVLPKYSKSLYNKTEMDYAFGWGTSNLRSWGNFTLSRRGNVVTVEGVLRNDWHDNYNWNPGEDIYIPFVGNVEDKQLKIMEYYKGAKPFIGTAVFYQSSSGTINLNNGTDNIKFKNIQTND